MIYLAIGGAVVLSLVGYMLAKVAGDTDDYYEQVRKRIDRDQELQDMYWAFFEIEGRAPTTRELWAMSPPEFTMKGDSDAS